MKKELKIVNRRKFFLSIMLSTAMLFTILFSTSKYTLSHTNLNYKKTYISSGDTLWEIAKEQQINNCYYKNKDIRDIISDIKKFNNLKSCNLWVGQEIKIPII